MSERRGPVTVIHDAVARRQLRALADQPETLGAAAAGGFMAGVVLGLLAVGVVVLLALAARQREAGHVHG